MRIQLKVISVILFLLFLFNFTNSFAYQTENDSINKIVIQGGIGSGFGNQVVSGDFNGDGVSDIIITSAFPSDNFPLKISIFYGGSDIDTTADLRIFSDTVYTNYNEYDIANAHDVNGDGCEDLIVGFYSSMNYTGRAFVYFGGNPMNAEADLVINGYMPYSGFGNEVSSAGDVNGDGFYDFLVSASIGAYFQTDTSKVFLFLGGADPDTIPDLVIISSSIDDNFGTSLASVGDINTDGFDDFVIGYKQGSDKVYIYCGSQILDDSVDFILQNFQPYSDFGFSLCENIDLNNDGYCDIVIGAPKFDFSGGGAERYGRVYVYWGSEFFNTVPDLVFTGDEVLGQFGYAISSAGYFNEDEYQDIVVGAPFDYYYYGKAFIFYGGEVWDNLPDIIFNGEFGSIFTFGGTISSCDFNNDGLNEVLFGSRQSDWGFDSKNLIWRDQVYLYYFVPPAYKIQYEATNFIYEEPNSFTFDVYIKNNGQYPWQYRNGSLTFTFNNSILRNGSLLWSIVPGFSDFPIQQQPQNAVVYNSYTIGTQQTIPFEGYIFNPGEELRFSRFRIQTTDSNFAIQPHYLRFFKTGLNKTSSSRWVWYNEGGRLFNPENISFIDLQHEVLPVELISFTASVNYTIVQLKWETATELNNQGFEIQRKIENSDWISIGFIAGQGTTQEITSYYFEDDISELNTNRHYYRLKQIDFNGTFAYSDEVEVIIQPLDFSLSQNYPNPFNPTTTIKYEIPKTSNVKIYVFDMLGRLVAAITDEEKTAGRYQAEFNAVSLSSGVYYYRIQAGDFNQTKKMQLIK